MVLAVGGVLPRIGPKKKPRLVFWDNDLLSPPLCYAIQVKQVKTKILLATDLGG